MGDIPNQNNIYETPDVVNGFVTGNLLWLDEKLDQALFAWCNQMGIKAESVCAIDLGCGRGAFGRYLIAKHHIAQYIGVDNSQGMVKAANANLRKFGNATVGKANFRDQDNSDLASLKKSFDMVIASGAGDGVEDYWEHIDNLISYAKDNGFIFAMDYPSRITPGNRIIIPSPDSSIKTGLDVSLDMQLHEIIFRLLQSKPEGLVEFLKLYTNKAFFKYSQTATAPTLATINEFVNAAGPDFGQVRSRFFNPVIVVFQVTPELRELVRRRGEQ